MPNDDARLLILLAHLLGIHAPEAEMYTSYELG